MHHGGAFPAALLLIALVFAGCAGPGPSDDEAPPGLQEGETDDPAQVAAGNNVLHLHGGAQDSWMATEMPPRDGRLQGEHLMDDGTWHAFPLRPTTAMNLGFKEDSTIRVTLVAEADSVGVVAQATQPETRVRLLLDGVEYASQTRSGAGGSFSLPSPDLLAAGTGVTLEVCICPSSQATLPYTYQVRTDGTSLVSLPLVWPRFVDPAVPDAPPGGEHRSPDIQESPVTVQQRPDGTWVARKAVNISNGVGDAATLDLLLRSVNGNVRVLPWGEDHYWVRADLEGRGDTEQQARQRLADLHVEHEDSEEGGGLVVATRIEDRATHSHWDHKAGHITADVPRHLLVERLDAGTTNGRAYVEGLEGVRFVLGTVNGDAVCDRATVESVRLSVSNGGASCSGSADDVDASTTNGNIHLDLSPRAGGSWEASATNGNILVRVPEGADYGYDVQGRTSNGAVDFDFQETQEVGSQSAQSRHERTEGFEGRGIRTVVELATVNGNVIAQGS